MQFKPLTRVALATALIFAFSACGDSSSGGPAFDGEATTAETESAADDAADMMADVTYAMNFGRPTIGLSTAAAAKRFAAKHPALAGSVAATLQQRGLAMPGLTISPSGGIQFSASTGCTISSSGNDGDPFDPYDGNENGIPDDWHVKATCVAQDSTDPGNIVTQTTLVEISGKENTSALWGYTSALHYEINAEDEEGNGGGIRYELTDVLDIRSGSGNADTKFSARLWDRTDGTLEEEQGGEERHVSFDPDGTISLEADLPDGAFTFNGRQWFANTDDVSLSFTIQTTDPLEFDSACFDVTDPPFTDGTVVGHLNGNAHSASFEVNFTGCGTYTIAVDNTSDEPVVVTREQPRHGLAARR